MKAVRAAALVVALALVALTVAEGYAATRPNHLRGRTL